MILCRWKCCSLRINCVGKLVLLFGFVLKSFPEHEHILIWICIWNFLSLYILVRNKIYMHCRERNTLQSDVMSSFSPRLQQLYLTSNTKQITESSELEVTTGQREIALISWWFSLFSIDDILKYETGRLLWSGFQPWNTLSWNPNVMPVRNIIFLSYNSWWLMAAPKMLGYWRYPLNVWVIQWEGWACPIATRWVILIACLTQGRTQARALQKIPRDLSPVPLFHQWPNMWKSRPQRHLCSLGLCLSSHSV